MDVPFFHLEEFPEQETGWAMPEEASRHIVTVLRMRVGDRMRITDGRGRLAEAVVAEADRRSCLVSPLHQEQIPRADLPVAIGVSLLKHAARFEWFLEKACELGVGRVLPLLCRRTERSHFRPDRMRGIAVSAMLQSQRAWLTEVSAPQPFEEALASTAAHRYIAHCMEGVRRRLSAPAAPGEALLLVGPEGDFTSGEVEAALAAGFTAVTLGEARLRTETAAMAGAALLCLG